MSVMAIPKFEHFFRVVEELDIDKDDLRRYNEFINQKIYDLLLRAQAPAKANARDIIEPPDLPITKGLEHCMQEFREIDREIHLQPILDELTNRPTLDLAYSVETEKRLPQIAGGLSVALARAFKIIDPKLKNPSSAQWEQAFRIFNLLL